MKFKTLCLLAIAMPILARAEDLGQFGRIYEIVEPDFRAVIQAQVAQKDWKSEQDRLLKKTDSYLDELEVFDKPVALESSVRYFEPTYTLNRPLDVPVKQADGTWVTEQIGQAGQVINILDQSRPVTAFLFIDGRDEEQVEFVKKVIEVEPFQIVPVLTAGNPQDLGEKTGFPFYYITPWQDQYFGITNTPSLAFPGGKGRRRELGVAVFAPPYTTSEVTELWPN